MNTCRCATCGRTNDHRLLSDATDFTPGPFYDDPYGKYPWDKVCDDCLNIVASNNEPFVIEQDIDDATDD